MDPFDDAKPEFSGTLITMEFGQAGRISQLWASDPTLPEEGEDFQFVLPPVQFGEEDASDYTPGTILIGVRSSPDEPWIVSRNQGARVLKEDEEGESDEAEVDLELLFSQSKVGFEYFFPFLDGLQVTGQFHEIPGVLPQVAWDIEIKNTGRRTIEIGELGFPLAFNNLYDGFGWSDDQLKKLWQSRVYVHKSIGGGTSYVFAQRMTAENPGLLVFPGPGTGWEFSSHVAGTLHTPHEWEGIPIVYVHSKATIEREEWPSWFNEHTSLILEPGDSRTFSMRFVPCDSDKHDGVALTLGLCGRPTVKLIPSAVAPIDVGIAVEVTGVTPKRFFVSRETMTEVDTDENGGFCFVKPSEPGSLIVSFQDGDGVMCHSHLMFTEPLQTLITKRADWITKHQVVNKPGSAMDKAIALTNIATEEQVLSDDEYLESSGLECSLADALFLAEKNSIYPDPAQIKALNEYVEVFLRGYVQNPSNDAVASILVGGIPMYFGRPMSYPIVANLYHALSRVARVSQGLTHQPKDYLLAASRTYEAMFTHGWRMYVRTVGVLGFSQAYDLLADLESEGLADEATSLRTKLTNKAQSLLALEYPFAGETVMDTSGFEEVFSAAKFLDNDEHMERTIRCAFAVRSLAPSWWWYGSDKRHFDGGESNPLKALIDRGEACLAHTTIPNSLIFFGVMDRDYLALPEAYLRMACGGMLGPWALIREDGAASMCYCPDLASKQAGYNPFTGSSGLGYFHYLRGVSACVFPNRELGLFSFGCQYLLDEDTHVVRPWDGVGRRVILRQIGVTAEARFGQIKEMRLSVNLRSCRIILANPCDHTVETSIWITGLWGCTLTVAGRTIPARNGGFEVPITLLGRSEVVIEAEAR